jgi:Lipoproteins
MRYLLAVLLLTVFTLPAHAFPRAVSGSYYHSKFEGRTMACGGRFSNENLTAASNHHPCGTLVRVSYRGRSVVVEVTDRCGRCGIDLTRAAARELGMVSVGRARVEVERVDETDETNEARIEGAPEQIGTYAERAGGRTMSDVQPYSWPKVSHGVAAAQGIRVATEASGEPIVPLINPYLGQTAH